MQLRWVSLCSRRPSRSRCQPREHDALYWRESRDPQRGVITVLLTNRCYPDDSPASKAAVHLARQRFNNAVMRVVDAHGVRETGAR